MVEDRAFRHKIEYFMIFLKIVNLKWHRNPITGSSVTAILLNGWILPIGGASAVDCAAYPLFFINYFYIFQK